MPVVSMETSVPVRWSSTDSTYLDYGCRVFLTVHLDTKEAAHLRGEDVKRRTGGVSADERLREEHRHHSQPGKRHHNLGGGGGGAGHVHTHTHTHTRAHAHTHTHTHTHTCCSLPKLVTWVSPGEGRETQMESWKDDTIGY